jgi:hypothetical protein
MKHYILIAALLASLASCSNGNSEATASTNASKNTDEAAISAQLQKDLDDPASYQPVSFQLDDPWTKRDSVELAQMIAGDKTTLTKYAQADSAQPAGHRYQHKYRAKNKMGALVLSDATAVVYPGGRVVIMPF